jgi:hypothetical protein
MFCKMQNMSWKFEALLSSQIFFSVWNSDIYYCVHRRPPFVSIPDLAELKPLIYMLFV